MVLLYFLILFLAKMNNFDQIWKNGVVVFLDSLFVLKWNFASPGTKIHQKYFKIKVTPIWHINRFINDSLWKAIRRKTRILASASEQVNCDTVDLTLSQTRFLCKWRLLLTSFFSFANMTINCFLVCEIHISNVVMWPIVIICLRASFHFIPHFGSWRCQGGTTPL